MKKIIFILIVGFTFLLSAESFSQAIARCPHFFLRDEGGNIINPLKGMNSDKPFSPKQTCGACHDYEKITEGYHFQQGWDRIRDDFGVESGKPWVLSDGMMGKW